MLKLLLTSLNDMVNRYKLVGNWYVNGRSIRVTEAAEKLIKYLGGCEQQKAYFGQIKKDLRLTNATLERYGDPSQAISCFFKKIDDDIFPFLSLSEDGKEYLNHLKKKEPVMENPEELVPEINKPLEPEHIESGFEDGLSEETENFQPKLSIKKPKSITEKIIRYLATCKNHKATIKETAEAIGVKYTAIMQYANGERKDSYLFIKVEETPYRIGLSEDGESYLRSLLGESPSVRGISAGFWKLPNDDSGELNLTENVEILSEKTDPANDLSEEYIVSDKELLKLLLEFDKKDVENDHDFVPHKKRKFEM